MTWDQVDAIVIEELQDAIDRNLTPDRDEGGEYLDVDWETIEAMEKVLAYFMPRQEFEDYRRELALQKLTTQSIVIGMYDESESESTG